MTPENSDVVPSSIPNSPTSTLNMSALPTQDAKFNPGVNPFVNDYAGDFVKLSKLGESQGATPYDVSDHLSQVASHNLATGDSNSTVDMMNAGLSPYEPSVGIGSMAVKGAIKGYEGAMGGLKDYARAAGANIDGVSEETSKALDAARFDVKGDGEWDKMTKDPIGWAAFRLGDVGTSIGVMMAPQVILSVIAPQLELGVLSSRLFKVASTGMKLTEVGLERVGIAGRAMALGGGTVADLASKTPLIASFTAFSVVPLADMYYKNSGGALSYQDARGFASLTALGQALAMSIGPMGRLSEYAANSAIKENAKAMTAALLKKFSNEAMAKIEDKPFESVGSTMLSKLSNPMFSKSAWGYNYLGSAINDPLNMSVQTLYGQLIETEATGKDSFNLQSIADSFLGMVPLSMITGIIHANQATKHQLYKSAKELVDKMGMKQIQDSVDPRAWNEFVEKPFGKFADSVMRQWGINSAKGEGALHDTPENVLISAMDVMKQIVVKTWLISGGHADPTKVFGDLIPVLTSVSADHMIELTSAMQELNDAKSMPDGKDSKDPAAKAKNDAIAKASKRWESIRDASGLTKKIDEIADKQNRADIKRDADLAKNDNKFNPYSASESMGEIDNHINTVAEQQGVKPDVLVHNTIGYILDTALNHVADGDVESFWKVVMPGNSSLWGEHSNMYSVIRRIFAAAGGNVERAKRGLASLVIDNKLDLRVTDSISDSDISRLGYSQEDISKMSPDKKRYVSRARIMKGGDVKIESPKPKEVAKPSDTSDILDAKANLDKSREKLDEFRNTDPEYIRLAKIRDDTWGNIPRNREAQVDHNSPEYKDHENAIAQLSLYLQGKEVWINYEKHLNELYDLKDKGSTPDASVQNAPRTNLDNMGRRLKRHFTSRITNDEAEIIGEVVADYVIKNKINKNKIGIHKTIIDAVNSSGRKELIDLLPEVQLNQEDAAKIASETLKRVLITPIEDTTKVGENAIIAQGEGGKLIQYDNPDVPIGDSDMAFRLRQELVAQQNSLRQLLFSNMHEDNKSDYAHSVARLEVLESMHDLLDVIMDRVEANRDVQLTGEFGEDLRTNDGRLVKRKAGELQLQKLIQVFDTYLFSGNKSKNGVINLSNYNLDPTNPATYVAEMNRLRDDVKAAVREITPKVRSSFMAWESIIEESFRKVEDNPKYRGGHWKRDDFGEIAVDSKGEKIWIVDPPRYSWIPKSKTKSPMELFVKKMKMTTQKFVNALNAKNRSLFGGGALALDKDGNLVLPKTNADIKRGTEQPAARGFLTKNEDGEWVVEKSLEEDVSQEEIDKEGMELDSDAKGEPILREDFINSLFEASPEMLFSAAVDSPELVNSGNLIDSLINIRKKELESVSDTQNPLEAKMLPTEKREELRNSLKSLGFDENGLDILSDRELIEANNNMVEGGFMLNGKLIEPDNIRSQLEGDMSRSSPIVRMLDRISKRFLDQEKFKKMSWDSIENAREVSSRLSVVDEDNPISDTSTANDMLNNKETDGPQDVSRFAKFLLDAGYKFQDASEIPEHIKREFAETDIHTYLETIRSLIARYSDRNVRSKAGWSDRDVRNMKILQYLFRSKDTMPSEIKIENDEPSTESNIGKSFKDLNPDGTLKIKKEQKAKKEPNKTSVQVVLEALSEPDSIDSIPASKAIDMLGGLHILDLLASEGASWKKSPVITDRISFRASLGKVLSAVVFKMDSLWDKREVSAVKKETIDRLIADGQLMQDLASEQPYLAGFRQTLLAGADKENMVNAIVLLNNANIETFMHEFMHHLMSKDMMPKEYQDKLIKAYGGNQEEIADSLVMYFRYEMLGESYKNNPDIKDVAEYIKGIAQTTGKSLKGILKPEVAEFFKPLVNEGNIFTPDQAAASQRMISELLNNNGQKTVVANNKPQEHSDPLVNKQAQPKGQGDKNQYNQQVSKLNNVAPVYSLNELLSMLKSSDLSLKQNRAQEAGRGAIAIRVSDGKITSIYLDGIHIGDENISVILAKLDEAGFNPENIAVYTKDGVFKANDKTMFPRAATDLLANRTDVLLQKPSSSQHVNDLIREKKVSYLAKLSWATLKQSINQGIKKGKKAADGSESVKQESWKAPNVNNIDGDGIIVGFTGGDVGLIEGRRRVTSPKEINVILDPSKMRGEDVADMGNLKNRPNTNIHVVTKDGSLVSLEQYLKDNPLLIKETAPDGSVQNGRKTFPPEDAEHWLGFINKSGEVVMKRRMYYDDSHFTLFGNEAVNTSSRFQWDSDSPNVYWLINPDRYTTDEVALHIRTVLKKEVRAFDHIGVDDGGYFDARNGLTKPENKVKRRTPSILPDPDMQEQSSKIFDKLCESRDPVELKDVIDVEKEPDLKTVSDVTISVETASPESGVTYDPDSRSIELSVSDGTTRQQAERLIEHGIRLAHWSDVVADRDLLEAKGGGTFATPEFNRMGLITTSNWINSHPEIAAFSFPDASLQNGQPVTKGKFDTAYDRFKQAERIYQLVTEEQRGGKPMTRKERIDTRRAIAIQTLGDMFEENMTQIKELRKNENGDEILSSMTAKMLNLIDVDENDPLSFRMKAGMNISAARTAEGLMLDIALQMGAAKDVKELSPEESGGVVNWNRMKRAIAKKSASFAAATQSFWGIAKFMDHGNPNGVFSRIVRDYIEPAMQNERDLDSKFYKKVWQKLEAKFGDDPTMRESSGKIPWVLGAVHNVEGMALSGAEVIGLYMATEGGRITSKSAKKIMKSSKITEKQINSVTDLVMNDPKLFKFMEVAKEMFEEAWPAFNETYKRLHGGKSLGHVNDMYFPLMWNMMDEELYRSDERLQNFAMGTEPPTKRGMDPSSSKERSSKTPRQSMPLLDVWDVMTVYHSHVNNYVAKAPTIKMLMEVVNNREVIDSVRGKFVNNELFSTFQQLVEREMTLSGRLQPFGMFERSFSNWRQTMAKAALTMNPAPVMKQWTSVMPAMTMLPITVMPRLMGRIAYGYYKAMVWQSGFGDRRGVGKGLSDSEMAFSGVPEFGTMVNEVPNIRRRVIDLNTVKVGSQAVWAGFGLGELTKLQKLQNWVKQGPRLLKVTDAGVCYAIYTTAKEEGIRTALSEGKTQEQANKDGIAFAKDVLRVSNDPSNFTEMSMMQTNSGELIKSGIPFSGFMFKQMQMTTEKILFPAINAYLGKDGGEFAKIMAGAGAMTKQYKVFLFSMLLPGMAMGVMVRGRAQRDKDEVMRDVLAYNFSALPFVGGYLANRIGGQDSLLYSALWLDTGTKLFESIGNTLGYAVGSEKWEPYKDSRKFAYALSSIKGFPMWNTRALDRIYEYTQGKNVGDSSVDVLKYVFSGNSELVLKHKQELEDLKRAAVERNSVNWEYMGKAPDPNK